MADFLIRPTEASDLPAITAIYREAVVTGTASYELEAPSQAEMTRRWQELAGRGFPHLVAFDQEAVLGYAYAGPYRPRPAYRYSVEDSVYISPAAQRHGIGRDAAHRAHRPMRSAGLPADDRGHRRRNGAPRFGAGCTQLWAFARSA